MANDNDASIAAWLKDKGYTEEEQQKILAKLAQHDRETLSDAVFDSIGGDGKSLDQMIADMLRD